MGQVDETSEPLARLRVVTPHKTSSPRLPLTRIALHLLTYPLPRSLGGPRHGVLLG